jgi:hypothetical protein
LSLMLVWAHHRHCVEGISFHSLLSVLSWNVITENQAMCWEIPHFPPKTGSWNSQVCVLSSNFAESRWLSAWDSHTTRVCFRTGGDEAYRTSWVLRWYVQSSSWVSFLMTTMEQLVGLTSSLPCSQLYQTFSCANHLCSG